jgi:hypothetical protein
MPYECVLLLLTEKEYLVQLPVIFVVRCCVYSGEVCRSVRHVP